MVEIIDCKDMMGQSKSDFLSGGVRVGIDHLPRGMLWIQFESAKDLKRAAELLGVNVISRRGSDYVFAIAGTIYYARD